MSRMAVHPGSAWVRVAVDDPRPRLLAALPVGDAAPAEVLWGGLVALLDRPVDELVVVHGWAAPPAVPPGVAAAVRLVPAAVAVVVAGGGPARGGAPGGQGPPAGPDTVVVDAGHSGTEIARVSRGRVVVARRVAVGGAVLDAATAELLGPAPWPQIRAARETLSLQPVVRVGTPPVEVPSDVLGRALAPHLARIVDAVRRVCDGADPGRSPPPVVLVGGVARMPLLAEFLDAAGVGGVRVADRPDSAAVVGALRLPPVLLGPPVRQPVSRRPTTPQPVTRQPAPPSAPETAAPAARWLPPVPPRRLRPLRRLATAGAATVALCGLYAAGAALPAPEPVPLAAAGELVQYGYAVRLPAGWAHTGGLPERRRSLLTPAGAPDGGNLISVERTPLGYDADAEPRRARAELRAEFARAVGAGAPLAGFDDDARFAGRSVVGYREGPGAGPDGEGPAPDAAWVDWFVILEGDAQLSVGCRHTAAGREAVAAACATVVGSVRRTA